MIKRQAPTILGLYLINIQTYIRPTFIPFSAERTVIRGPNDVGKSVTSKVYMLFGGMIPKDEYAVLINYDADEGCVYMYLDNRTILECKVRITRKNAGSENEVRIGTPTFTLYNWQLTATLRQWNEYSSEIAEYLGWVSITDENFCVNIMDGKRNVLVNTSPTLNTKLTEAICRNRDLEMRLQHIEDALKEVKNVRKQLNTELDILQSKLTYFHMPVESLINYRDTLNYLLYNLNIVFHIEDQVTELVQTQIMRSHIISNKEVYLLDTIQSYSDLNLGLQDKQRHYHTVQLQKEILKHHLILVDIEDLARAYVFRMCLTKMSESQRKYRIDVEMLEFMYNYADMFSRTQALEKSLEQVQGKIHKIQEIQHQLDKYRSVAGMVEDIAQYAYNTVSLNRIKYTVMYVAGRSRIVDILELVTGYTQLQLLKRRHVNLQVLIKAISMVQDTKTISVLSAQLEVVKSAKSSIPVCPYCNQIIESEECQC